MCAAGRGADHERLRRSHPIARTCLERSCGGNPERGHGDHLARTLPDARGPGLRAPGRDDGRREDRPDDPAREGLGRPGRASRTCSSGSVLSGGGGSPTARTTRPAGTHGRGVPGGRARRPAWASRCSTASTPSTATTTSSARRSSRTTSGWAPPTTRTSSNGSGSATALEMAATGIRWDFAPVRGGARRTSAGAGPTRATARTRPLVATLGAAFIRGLQGAGPGRARTAAAATAKHFVGDGGTAFGLVDRPTDYLARPGRHRRWTRRPCARSTWRRTRRPRGRRPDRHGVVLEHGGRQGPRRPPPAHRGAQGRARVHRVRRLRLGRRRPGRPRLRTPPSRQAINAGIDMVMVPYDGAAVPGRRPRPGSTSGDDPPGADRRRREPDPARQVRDGPVREPDAAGRRTTAAVGSDAHRALAREAVADRRSCSRPRPGVLPIGDRRRPSCSPGRAPTTSASSPAAGRSRGRAARARSRPGTTIAEALARTPRRPA